MKGLTIFLLMSLQATVAMASPSLLQMLQDARARGEKLVLVINDPIEITLTEPQSVSKTPYSRTTLEIPILAGLPLNLEKSASESFCVLNVWRGMSLSSDPDNPQALFKFQLQGIWQVFDISRKKIPNQPAIDAIPRAEYEIALWPTRANATLIEKSLYSIDLVTKSTDRNRPADVTDELLRRCFGQSVQVFRFTP